MKKLYFNCKLKSDIIISASSATQGHQLTLDFIPGSNFLGICAQSLYAPSQNKLSQIDLSYIFHTGDVRFGDAHLKIEGIRSLKIPAAMYYPKLMKMEDVCYVHHAYKREADKEYQNGPQQLKQCRNGFYAFKEQHLVEKTINTAYAIKSAYDYEKRRSENEKMFGYESIEKGMEFLFEVELSDNALKFEKYIIEALTGIRRLGRSKTAQYGLVSISEAMPDCFPEYDGRPITDENGQKMHVVYAESRLIFINPDTLQPTFTPNASNLGFDDKEAEIDWSLSQIRTFKYAPWNYKRQTYDADRCGIEKGSVFVVRSNMDAPQCQRVGGYKNEGFGKVIYNPVFLDFDSNSNGKAKWTFRKERVVEKKENGNGNDKENELIKFIKLKKREKIAALRILEIVNCFVENNINAFRGEAFASQWGKIRSIASQSTSTEEIKTELFTKKRTVKRAPSPTAPAREEIKPDAYLTHGVAAEKWKKRNRKKLLEKFVEDIEKDSDLGQEYVQKAIINLASQMQKELRK